MPARTPHPPAEPDAGFPSPEAAEAAFYAAFASLDIQAMARVWGDGEGVVCVHPGGGLLVGKREVMQSWAEILGEATPPRLAHRLVNRIAAGGLCVHLVEETIRAGGDPRAPANRVLASNVYARQGAGWRLLAHHASLPLMEPRGTRGSERQLH